MFERSVPSCLVGAVEPLKNKTQLVDGPGGAGLDSCSSVLSQARPSLCPLQGVGICQLELLLLCLPCGAGLSSEVEPN